MKTLKQISLMLCFAIIAFAFTACGGNKEKLVLSSDKQVAVRGEVVTFVAVLEDEDGKTKSDNNITYEIVSGEASADLNENKLTIKETAVPGVKIEVVAKLNNKTSNKIEITVSVPLTAIEIETEDNVTNVLSGSYISLTKTTTPADAESASNIQWVVVEGADICNINANMLFVKPGVSTGETIKVKAVYGTIESNTLTLTVGYPLETLTISATGSTNIQKGGSKVIDVTAYPSNATGYSVDYMFEEGGDYATVTNNVLVVDEDTPTNTTIKVKAVSGTIESNVLTFTVSPTQEEINKTKFMISAVDEIELDKNATSAKVLTAEIYNLNFDLITDKNLTFTVIEGEEYLAVSNNNNICSFNLLGHGEAVVEIGIEGVELVKKQVRVNVIVPPELVQIPDVFVERTGYVYNFSKVKPLTLEAETLPFVATAIGTNVCEDIRYTFTHEDGSNGDSVATYNYETNAITFNKTGRVTVTAMSNSGSRIETSTSYSFNINEGFNVYSFKELQYLANNSKYTGQPINIVVLEKPVSQTNYEYGYDLVTDAALKAKNDQTFNDIYGDGTTAPKGNAHRINFCYKSVHINGNNHKIDLSQLRPITKKELTDRWGNGTLTSEWTNIYGIISIIPWNSGKTDEGGRYYAKIYDLEMVGNCGISYDTYIEGKKPYGVINSGIAIGSPYMSTLYDVDIKNITLSKLNAGLQIRKAPTGIVENYHAYDCFSNGIEVGSSVIALKNLKFGACGAAGIEFTPGESDMAGENANLKQNITFDGYLIMDNNLNNGETVYFNSFKIGNYTIPQIIGGLMQQFDSTQLSHLMTADGKFGFACFTLVDLSTFATNHTTYSYPSYLSGGIINAKDLPKNGSAINTTHQFIELNVDLTAFGMGDAGTVLLYNHNYIAK